MLLLEKREDDTKKEYQKPLLQAEERVADTHIAAGNLIISPGEDIYDEFPDE